MNESEDHLKVSCRHIQGNTVTSHVLHGLVRSDSLALFADDHSQLYLVVELLAPKRDLDLLPSSNVGGGRLHKEERFGGHRVTKLRGVLSIVPSYSHDLP